jgi:hypothetical protein
MKNLIFILLILLVSSCNNELDVEFEEVAVYSADKIDDDNSSEGFGGGVLNGVEYSAGLVLKQENTIEHGASWTPEYLSLVSYWKMNGDWNDSIGSNHASLSGAPTFTSVDQKIGAQAGDFSGETKSLTIPYNSDFIFTEVSACAWVKKISLDTVHGGVLGAWDAPGNERSFIITEKNGTDSWAVYISGDGTGSADITSADTIPLNTYQHLCFTHSASGTKLIVDGILKGSNTSMNSLFVSSANFNIAGFSEGYRADQYIDDVALWSKELSESQIKFIYDKQRSKYAGTFTSRIIDTKNINTSWTGLKWFSDIQYSKELITSSDSLYTDLVGIWNFNTDASDSSGNGINGTVNNMSHAANDGVLKGSAYFNGNLSSVVLASPNVRDSFDATWTTSMWIKHNYQVAKPISWSWIASKPFTSHVQPYYQVGIRILSTHNIAVYIREDSGAGSYLAAVTTIGLLKDRWYHLAVSVDITTPALKIFINGKNVVSDTVKAGNYTNYATDFALGRNMNLGGNSYDFKGSIDEFALWKRVLTEAEVLELYRKGRNEVKFQVRSCSSSDCSDGIWKGEDNTGLSYFSELNNNLATDPSLLFSNHSASISNNRYFQYKVLMQSDDEQDQCSGSPCMPKINSVEITE